MIAGLTLLFIPLFDGTDVLNNDSGITQIVITKQTILETNNPNALIMLLFPWIITGIVMFTAIMSDPIKGEQQRIRWRWKSYGWACTLVLIIFIALTISSIGWFYVPTLLFLITYCIVNK
jgi:hypothetical protein